MPKKILFESAVHQLLWAGKRHRQKLRSRGRLADADHLGDWLHDLELTNPSSGKLHIKWSNPVAGETTLLLKEAKFYTRGDAEVHAKRQQSSGQPFAPDRVKLRNERFFDDAFAQILATAGLFADAPDEKSAPYATPSARLAAEEKFHDNWAASEDLTKINVRHRNEAPTAPEMRHIRKSLGNLYGKTLLDIGCGLGEASVYFALEGADVTATDLSPGMCAATDHLAELNGVTLETHVAAAESLGLGDRQFDIIYTGNTLHHADTEMMMQQLLPHLKSDGVFVSWDPLAYNPVINVYRSLAGEVHTEDEHPLTRGDIASITRHFGQTETAWYWLTANLVFIAMVITKITHFRSVRLWKAVIDECDDWRWLYNPLAALDRVILRIIPWLRYWCWNVVIIGRQPRQPKD